ncbi:MAG: helix-turn-helix domain-containing protein [Anaerolineales bacterium]|nr:helix-turn-helix domain-containing protein [Anaerolineales bacterium]
MNKTRRLHSLEVIKLLGDSRRLQILQFLMADAATLSQLGRLMEIHPAKVRYHLKQLQEAGLVELAFTQDSGGIVEKYYRATAQAYLINVAITPEPPEQGQVVLMGSHDPALDLLAAYLEQDNRLPNLVLLPIGSLDGLVALRQGLCQLTGCHLYDPQSSEFNTPYVRHFFPGQAMQVVTLAHRQQGLLVAPGNPHQINGLADLSRTDLAFINRKAGSGTRLWLDRQVAQLGLEPGRIRGYTQEVNTHSQVALAVQRGQADCGLAVLAAARQAGLDFIPLFEERFDLVVPQDGYQSNLLVPAFEYLNTARFRAALAELGGYDSHETGKEIHVI